MKNNLKRISCLLLTVALCAAVFCMSAYAADGYYASNEYGSQTPPASIDSITVSTENVKLPDAESNDPLTPDGNLTLIDDILQSEHFASVETTETVANKQFITVQSKNGNYFYLVIDRSGDTENVYFLNLVDEADLLALMEDGSEESIPDTCICPDKCVIGSINTDCPICRTAMSDCVGKEAIKEPEPTPEPVPDDTDNTNEKSNSTNLALIVILLVGLAGGGAFYWFKMRKPASAAPDVNDLDDYEFEEEQEETEPDDDEIEDNEEE